MVMSKKKKNEFGAPYSYQPPRPALALDRDADERERGAVADNNGGGCGVRGRGRRRGVSHRSESGQEGKKKPDCLPYQHFLSHITPRSREVLGTPKKMSLPAQ